MLCLGYFVSFNSHSPSTRAVFSFWRDAGGHEVDFVVKTGREKITLSLVALATFSTSAATTGAAAAGSASTAKAAATAEAWRRHLWRGPVLLRSLIPLLRCGLYPLRGLIPLLRLTLQALRLRRHVTGSLIPNAPRGAVCEGRCGGP